MNILNRFGEWYWKRDRRPLPSFPAPTECPDHDWCAADRRCHWFCERVQTSKPTHRGTIMSTVDPRHETDERRTWCAEYNGEALFADGFDDAIVGVAERGGQPPLVVYDADKCIEIIMERDGSTYTEALEDISVNAMGAWLGDGTPLFLWRYKAMAGP